MYLLRNFKIFSLKRVKNGVFCNSGRGLKVLKRFPDFLKIISFNRFHNRLFNDDDADFMLTILI